MEVGMQEMSGMREATDEEVEIEILSTLFHSQGYEMEETELFRMVEDRLRKKGLRV